MPLTLLLISSDVSVFTQTEAETRNEGYLPEPPDVYDRVPVADSNFIKHRGLPSQVDLAKYFPKPGQQGKQGSCVGWATTYALKSYHEKRKQNWDFGPHVQTEGGKGEHIFSPAWTYNQVNKGKDRGAHIPHALDLLISKGAVSWADWPYTPSDFRKQPNAEQKRTAQKYRAKRYETIPIKNTEALKAELAKGYPMVIGVNSGPDRWKCCKNNSVYDGYTVKNKAGHAMVLIGYDDNKKSSRGHRGAFKLMDSDGNNWGTNGYGWVSYEFSKTFFYAAYALRDWEPGKITDVVTKLQAPRNVRASQGTEKDNILITWSKVTGALGYEILRSESATSEFSVITETAEPTFRDYSADTGKTMYYRVIAVNETEKSDENDSMTVSGYSAEQQITGQVQGLTGELLPNGHIKLTWQPLGLAGSYKITKEDVATGSFKNIANSVKTTWTDTKPAGGPNTYAVMASGKGSDSQPSESVTIEGKAGIPGQVNNLLATEGVHADKIILSWDTVPGAERYWVVRFNNQKGQWEEAGYSQKNTFSDNATTVLDGEKKAYSVRALAGIQAGPAAFPVRGFINKNVTRAGKPPLPPVNLRTEISGKKVSLYFSKSAETKEYYIFRRFHKDTEWKFLGSAKKNAFSEVIPGNGKLIFYAVKSLGNNGVESQLSAPVGFSAPLAKSTFKSRSVAPLLPLGKLSGIFSGTFYKADGGQADFTLELKSTGTGSEIIVSHSKKTYRTKIKGITEPNRILSNGFEISAEGGNYDLLYISCRNKSACGQSFRDTALRVKN